MKSSGKKYYLIYTLTFITVCLLVFFWFPLYGRSFVRAGDAYFQHTKALAFFGRWLRDLMHTLFIEHKLSLPVFSFSMGYGADALTTMHYYVLGDPLNLLAVFVPQEKTAVLYEILIFVRLYLSGIVFSFFCAYHKKENGRAVLSGSVLYVFSGYVMFAAVRHPYFVNPMIWFPLILIGAEEVRKKRFSTLFSVSVCMAAISNFYFFYMIVVMTILYVLWRIFVVFRRGELSKILLWIGRLFAGALLGLMMSAVLFWPVVRLFLSSSRGGSDGSIYVLYKASYYLSFLGGFMSFTGPGYWNHMGYTGIALLAVAVLFIKRKKNTDLKAAFIVIMLIALLPYGGYILNGFIYVLNRWTWAAGLLTAYILVCVWEDLFTLSVRETAMLGVVLVFAGGICYMCAYYMKYNSLAQLIVAAGAVAMPAIFSARPAPKHIMEISMVGVMCLGVIVNGWFAYSAEWVGYPLEFKTNEEMTGLLDEETLISADEETVSLAESNFLNSEADAVALMEDADPVRYSGHDLTRNASVLTGMHSPQFYWSLANENLDAFLQQMGNKDYLGYMYDDLDERTRLETLSAVRYFYTTDENYLPYGFERVDAEQNRLDNAWPLYENENALPLGFTYDSWVNSEAFDGTDAIGREEMMMQAVSLEEDSGVRSLGIPETKIEYTSKEMPYTIMIGNGAREDPKADKKAEILENGIRTKRDKVTVTLVFDGLENSETSLYVRGLDYSDGETPFSELSLRDKFLRFLHNRYASEADELHLLISGGTDPEEPLTQKDLIYYSRKHEWYNGRHDFVVNTGYSKDGRTFIQIRLPYKGIYTWDSLQVICSPMEQIDAQTAALGEDVLEEIDLHPAGSSGVTDQVTGSVSLSTPKILFLSIPHDSGWTAFVDGEKTKILRADNMFMAIPLAAGDHQIELRYFTPGLRAGFLATVAGIILLILIRRKMRRTPGV